MLEKSGESDDLLLKSNPELESKIFLDEADSDSSLLDSLLFVSSLLSGASVVVACLALGFGSAFGVDSAFGSASASGTGVSSLP